MGAVGTAVGVGDMAVAVAVVVLAVPDKPGVKVTGNVTDAELTTLPPGAAATHVEQTKPLKEVTGDLTGDQTGVTAIVGVTVGVIVGVIVGVMGTAVVVEEEEEATEEPLPLNREIGTALIAVPTTLQVELHVTSVVPQSEHHLM